LAKAEAGRLALAKAEACPEKHRRCDEGNPACLWQDENLITEGQEWLSAILSAIALAKAEAGRLALAKAEACPEERRRCDEGNPACHAEAEAKADIAGGSHCLHMSI